MPITRTVMVDDDGTGLTGTILNNAWLQTIYNQIDAATITTAYGTFLDLGVITGVNHNLNIPNSADKVVWYLSAAASSELTGIVAPATGPGTMHVLFNTGSPLLLRHLNTGSAGPNRLTCPGYVDYTLGSWHAITMIYSHISSGWLFLKAS